MIARRATKVVVAPTKPMKFGPKKSTIVGVFVLALTSCSSSADRPAVADTSAARLPLGLYQVIDRQCAYAPGVAEDCSRTRYIEFAKGVFRSLDKSEIGMATWLSADSAQQHDFNIRALRQGRFVGDREYVIEDGPLGKEWIVIHDGTITDYYFIRRARKTPAGDMAGQTHFTLRRTPRTAAIDRLLHYPAADE